MLKIASAALVGTLFVLGVAGCIESPDEAGVLRAKLATFPVMRTIPERVPQGIQRAIEQMSADLSGFPAQEVASALPTVRVWAVANASRVCLFSLEQEGGTGVTCRSLADAGESGIAITLIGTFGAGAVRRSITGIAPQGGGAVLATVATGRSVKIPVVDGVFSRVDFGKRPPDGLALIGRY